jgi:hypothetical protein
MSRSRRRTARLATLREAVAYLAKTVPKSERDMPAVTTTRHLGGSKWKEGSSKASKNSSQRPAQSLKSISIRVGEHLDSRE